MRAVTAGQMRAIDAAAVAREGEVALMRRAGSAIAAVARRYRRGGPIVGLAGNGNNGGDAFAALAELDGERICYETPGVRGSDARHDARERALTSGVRLRAYTLPADVARDADLLLDGLYGANARLPLDDATNATLATLRETGARVLALDIATGTDPTTGTTAGLCVRALATIALGRPKLGSFLDPGRAVTGDLWCAPIGMRDADGDGVDPDTFVLTDGEFDRLRPRRGDDDEKRSAGAPLVIAGSEQFPGAAILCARGAARAGAGYVTVAVPERAASAVRAHLVEQVVIAYDDRDPDAAIATILDLTNHNGAIAIGPGLGLSDAMGTIVRGVVARTTLPVVADASAFAHLTKHLDLLADKRAILTPHAGEFARLSGKGTVAPHERLPRLRAFVAEYGITTLLKGQVTLIADRDAVHLNPTGTSALATAGTGDVLTGIIATLLSQGLAPVDAGRVGAFWHGRAGRAAARHRTVGVTAGDLPDVLAEATSVEADGDLVRLW
jgi:NAD(P)H-hydrate epimerase